MGTITKALNLLNHISEHSPELGLSEFKNLTGQDKATTHRHLTELEANGFLEQNSQTRKYRLGGSILRLSSVRERTFPAHRIVSHWVEKLSEDVHELVHASLIQSEGMSPLYYHDSGIGGTRVYFSQAEILPFHATSSGLSALAFGAPEILKKVLKSDLVRFTEFTVSEKADLSALVEAARSNGFANINESFEKEVCSVAAPFYHNGIHAYGAIAIAVPASRMDEDKVKKLATELWNTCCMVSNDLGGVIPRELSDKWKCSRLSDNTYGAVK